MKYVKTLLPVLAIIVCVSAFGADAEVVQLAPKSVIPTWAVEAIQLVVTAAGGYAAWCLAKLFNLVFSQQWEKGRHAAAITALEHGIQDAEEEFVAFAKAASADGVLSAEEVAKAKEIAYRRALEVAKGPAFDLLKELGTDYVGNWISQLIQGKKTESNNVIVNTTGVDSIKAPANTDLKIDPNTATAGATATATVVRAQVVKPKEVSIPTHIQPSQVEIDKALAVLAAANHMQVRPEPHN